MTIEIFFLSLTLLYFLTHLFLLKGLNKSFRLKKNQIQELPKVSVIVAGRNESANIRRCIQSLSRTNYPAGKLEIILVNDHSTDNTFEIMKEATAGLDYFKVINSAESTSNNLKGKANAIDTAISQCTGEIIISTDADCEVPANWVRETVRYYSGNTAMICGFTKIKTDSTLFSKVQSLDWLYLLTLASSSAGLKMILSCVGNNLAFSKKAYNDAGGYSSIGFSVTEDLALMRKINSYSSLEIKYPIDRECIVETLPCSNLSELFSQKRRWFRGGIGINFLGYIVGFELYSMNVLLIFGLLFLNVKVFSVLVLMKFISELLLISKVMKTFNMNYLYKYYPAFSIYFAFYGLTLPLSFLFKTGIKWKGRKF
ncbi:MAG: glycosyltransferase [Ignavibacteria bacterium]|nr:glycosyltransferase [Ignavibacteria bacterium]